MTTFIARTPVDLLAVVPYALGFHPEESAVLLTFGEGNGGPGSFHARVDLPVGPADQDGTADLFEELALRHRAERVALVLYTEDGDLAQQLHDRAVPRLERSGVAVIDSLRVGSGRVAWAGDAADRGVPYDLSSHPFTAAQVMQGRVAHVSRDALAHTLAPDDPADQAAIAEAADALADRLIASGRRRTGASGVGTPVPLARALSEELRDQARWLREQLEVMEAGLASPSSPAMAARMLVLVALDVVREVAVAAMSRRNAAAQVELWRGLVRRAPTDLRPGPASLCALAAWLQGDGALAWCAVEKCLEVDPDDALGQYVAAMLESATPPSVWTPPPPGSLWVLGGADQDGAP